MTLSDFLSWLLTSVGAGAAVFAFIEAADKWFGPLPAKFKMGASVVLSFAFPIIAYSLLSYLGGRPFDLDGLFSAFATGWMVSQATHFVTQKPQEMPAKIEDVAAVPMSQVAGGVGDMRVMDSTARRGERGEDG